MQTSEPPNEAGSIAKGQTILEYVSDEEGDNTYVDTVIIVSDDDSYVDELDEENEDDEEFEIDDIDADLIEKLKQDQHASENKSLNSLHEFWVKHEIGRKALHSSIGVFTLWLYSLGFSHKDITVPLVVLFVILFAVDYVRLHLARVNRFACKHFWTLIRDLEQNSYNGTLYYIAGIVFVFRLYAKDISVMSVLLLSWADTAALTFGRQFGKYTWKITASKSVAGCLASFVMGTVTCFCFYGFFIPHVEPQALDLSNCASYALEWHASTSRMNLVVYSLCTGVIASFSEVVDVFGLDDNFTIPVLSGILMNLLVNCTRLQCTQIVTDAFSSVVVEVVKREALPLKETLELAFQRLLGSGIIVECV